MMPCSLRPSFHVLQQCRTCLTSATTVNATFIEYIKMLWFPRYFPDLLRSLSLPPWTKPLNWDLHINLEGEARIPFHMYVKPNSVDSPSASPATFPLDRLPVELQIHILSFCSAPTLFQIMRASPTHRDEAEKLFWADPETYYIIESPWLLSGGFPADTGNTFSFFPKVQNLEVTFMSERDLIRCNDDDFEIRWDEVRKFWNVLQERFPSVKHVVLNHSHESPERFRDDHSVSIALRALMRTCPQSLDARILIVDDAQSVKNRRAIDGEELMWERPLYQYGADGQWKKLAPYWQRTTILMPLKGFRGPAGLFESERYQGKRLWYQLIAVDVLAIEALDRYHFDEGRSIPFDCPVVDCDAHFDKAGQWMLHSITHDIKQMDWHWVNVLPGEVRSVFDARKKDLAEKRERTNGSVGLHELYNNRGSEERMELEKAMIHQLENDEDWYTGQQDVRESTLYENFEAEMTPWCCGQ